MSKWNIAWVFLTIYKCVTFVNAQKQRPNIVYILIDDLGWANVEWNNPRMKTPYLNQLLTESLLLNKFYVFEFCSPTRSALLSGRIPYHVNEDNGPACSPRFGIPLNMTTISDKLVNEAEYIAHQVGKWHLGMSSLHYVPYGRGFTTSLGYLQGDEDHFTQNVTNTNGPNGETCTGIDLWNTTNPAYGQNGTYGGYIYSKRAIEIINTHPTEKPLFLYLATQNCHGPLEVPQSYIDKFNYINNTQQRIYAAMTNFEDELIGNVTTALKHNNMWNNTLLFITSDNGGQVNHATNCPLRGGKFSNFEGGIRVFAMVSGGYLPIHRRNKTLNETVHIADVYSTLCSIVDIDATDHRAIKAGLPPIDSFNMWPLITGETNVSARTEFILSSTHSNHVHGAGMISGDYKILFGYQSPAFWTSLDWPNGSHGEPNTIYCGNATTGGCLFNIKEDISERIDLINKTEYQAIGQQLRERFIELNSTKYITDFGPQDPKCCEQIQKNGGYFGPWLMNETL